MRTRTTLVRGFTLMELVVVMALIGLLLSIAVPRYMGSLEQGKRHVLEHNLAQIRQAIDRHYADRGAYPDRLEDLVEHRYLRAVPVNPYTEAADWQVIAPTGGQPGAVYDVAESAATRDALARAAAAEEPAPAASEPATEPAAEPEPAEARP